MRNIGLHLRFEESFLDIVESAVLSGITTIQCFFIYSSSGRRIDPTPVQVKKFQQLREQHIQQLFMHGAYWINLADTARIHHPALRYDMITAKKLGFSHIVLHPGAYPPTSNKEQGIDAIARSLNLLLYQEHELTIVLENTAHGNRAIGSNIHDFGRILNKLDQPEKVRFCIDTAHAYAYGYDIASDVDRAAFILLVQRVIGVDAIALIHLNDSKTACGSYMDQHALLNEGYIKSDALQSFIQDDTMRSIPLVLELPNVPFNQQVAMVDMVKSWHEKPQQKIMKEQEHAHSN